MGPRGSGYRVEVRGLIGLAPCPVDISMGPVGANSDPIGPVDVSPLFLLVLSVGVCLYNIESI